LTVFNFILFLFKDSALFQRSAVVIFAGADKSSKFFQLIIRGFRFPAPSFPTENREKS
jgi:hypothetical protein